MYFITSLIVLNLGFSYCFIRHDVSELEYDHSHASEEWIEQPLDHFNTNNETWKMRYFKRLSFWKLNGPIYLFIGGEFTAKPDWIETDSRFTCQLAKETNGALFLSEHRYYGESMPVDIIDTSSMKYLSSKQALADLAALITTIKSASEFKSSKVVVIGGSYAGNLAVWMRLLYPDLVDAAVSSSAPVLAKKDFCEYLETVGDTYEKYGSTDCVKKISLFFKHIVELLKTPSGIDTLKKELNICNESDMNIVENQQMLLYNLITNLFANNATGRTTDSIKSRCDSLQKENWERSMQNSVESQYLRTTSTAVPTTFNLKNWTEITPNSDQPCFLYNYTAYIEYMKAHKNLWFSAWVYQKCTEFGYFATTSDKQPFSHNLPLDFWVKQCQAIFGEGFNEKRVDDGVAQTNAMYGGITPNVTNVVFTHGDMDPWHRLGVLKDLSDTAVVRITNGTSHCALLDSSDSSDSDALTKDREYVKDMIKKWIK